jgi:hypothetical protein
MDGEHAEYSLSELDPEPGVAPRSLMLPSRLASAPTTTTAAPVPVLPATLGPDGLWRLLSGGGSPARLLGGSSSPQLSAGSTPRSVLTQAASVRESLGLDEPAPPTPAARVTGEATTPPPTRRDLLTSPHPRFYDSLAPGAATASRARSRIAAAPPSSRGGAAGEPGAHDTGELLPARDARSALAAADRLRQAGVVLASSEMVLFEWLGRAGTPEFKDMLALIK